MTPDITFIAPNLKVFEKDLGTIPMLVHGDFHLPFNSSALLKQLILIATGTLTAGEQIKIELFERQAMAEKDKIWEDNIIDYNTINVSPNINYIDLDRQGLLHIKVTNDHSNDLSFFLKIKYE
ncbi:MAG: hypothetical protein ACOYWZ_08735 [Bacillota bacterium]